MSEYGSGELRTYVQRIRNTKTITFESQCGDVGNGINAQMGDFDILIQPFPYPQSVHSQRAIFHLKNFYICGQTAVQRASGVVGEDVSGFYVQINGLGMERSNDTSARACGQARGNQFYIPNKDGGSDNANSLIFQRVSGGEYEGSPILCSNPVGTLLNIKVFDADGNGALPIVDNANLYSVIQFCIELIPDEIVSNIK